MSCSVEGCVKPARSRSAAYCEAHYMRMHRYGDPGGSVLVRQGTFAPCQQCKLVMITRKFCSARCQTRASRGIDETEVRPCAECGIEIGRNRRSDAAWCSEKCAQASRSGRHTSVPLLGAKGLGQRDGWVCHLCREPVDPAVLWPHPRCGTVDHVIPIARGGLDDVSNLALAHAACNFAKGAKLLEQQASS